MKAKEFKSVAKERINAALNDVQQVENLERQFNACGNVFNYAAWCERNFEKNLHEDYTRKTTFTSDISIAEWYVYMEGIEAVTDTIYRCVTEWKDNIEFFAELIIAVNMKSWEHHARGNQKWSSMYAELYYVVKDLFFEWYDDDNEKKSEAIQYYFDYVD